MCWFCRYLRAIILQIINRALIEPTVVCCFFKQKPGACFLIHFTKQLANVGTSNAPNFLNMPQLTIVCFISWGRDKTNSLKFVFKTGTGNFQQFTSIRLVGLDPSRGKTFQHLSMFHIAQLVDDTESYVIHEIDYKDILY